MYISSEELMQLNLHRLDILFKMNFARYRLAGGREVKSEPYQKYVSHILCMNGAREESPQKRGKQEFLKRFEELIDDLQMRGFSAKSSDAIPVDENFRIMGGAHRLGAALTLGIGVNVEIREGECEEFDVNFFIKRGLSKKYLREIILDLIDYIDDARLILIHPCVTDFEYLELQELLKNMNILEVFSDEMKITVTELFHLKRLSYLVYPRNSKVSKEWCGTLEDNFFGLWEHASKSFGKNNLRVKLVSGAQPEKLINFKKRARAMIGKENFSVHTTDSKEEAKDILKSLFNDQSRTISKQPVSTIQLSFLQRIDGMWELDKAREKFVENSILCGSTPVGVVGIRQPNDVDFFTTAKQEKDFFVLAGLPFSQAGLLDYPYSLGLADLMYDSRNHFYFDGVKCVNLCLTKEMKIARNHNPKDSFDVKQILNILENRRQIELINRLRRSYFERKINVMLQRQKYLKVLLNWLARFPTLYSLVRVIYRKSFKAENE